MPLTDDGLLHMLGRIKASDCIAFLWSLAEATFFFIVADVWLSRLALADWRRCLRAIVWATLGALLGGLIMYAWGATRPEAAMRFLDWIPAIAPPMIDHSGAQLQNEGWIALFQGALAGVPYKIYAVQAGRLRYPLIHFLAASIAARMTRFLLVCLLVNGFARIFLQRYSLRARQMMHIAAWILFYIGYFAAIGF
jgi:membrane protein YqaA with SNARE-associated domain